MKHAKPKKSQRIKHRQALNDFLAMGADRSLEKLCQWYIKNVSNPPGRSIIGIWSVKHGWQDRAAEHDERVAGGVKEKVESAAIEETWDRVGDLTDLAQRALKKALDALEGDAMTVTDPYGVAALVNSALSSIKTVELLTGGPTERFGHTPRDHAPEWVLERLAARTTATAGDEIDIPETATQH